MPTKLMKRPGYGENYKYAHDYENNFNSRGNLHAKEGSQTIFTTLATINRKTPIKDFLKKRWKDI